MEQRINEQVHVVLPIHRYNELIQKEKVITDCEQNGYLFALDPYNHALVYSLKKEKALVKMKKLYDKHLKQQDDIIKVLNEQIKKLSKPFYKKLFKHGAKN